MIKQSQKGFAALEVVLIIVIVAILGFTGWYVIKANGTAKDTLSLAAGTNVAVTGKAKAKTPAKTTTTSSTACTYTMGLGTRLGAGGTFHQDMTFKNTSTNTCTLNGYPKTVLTDSGGTTVGSAAGNDTSTAAAAVTVAPGDTVHATLAYANSGVATGCSSSTSANVYATLPGASTALYTAFAYKWCPNFMVGPIQTGAGS
jgi:hypothetical protein